ncbi:Kazal-type serine protease inhibitor family protein [Hymenobacter metallilatus]|uniref:Kazal domain protein n=1 Tax=Hymenobacter metallilatus TaxID=2493666 RepID=A0A3R9PF44_9BACT|nr:Kazal-type serine protease inhibitor [Hymenobacter metallilatus]RSK36113.1 kazal domain protein [Hymenobacter metallilatus]
MLKFASLAASGLLLLACQRETPPTTDCIDPSKIRQDAMCTMEYAPVCGCNNQTYSNACQASNAGVKTFTQGPCPGTETSPPKGQ